MNNIGFKSLLVIYTLLLGLVLCQISESLFLQVDFNISKLWSIGSVLTIILLSMVNTAVVYMPYLEKIRLKDKQYAERLLKGRQFNKIFKWIILALHFILLSTWLYKEEFMYSFILLGLMAMQYLFIYLLKERCKLIINQFNDENEDLVY